MKRQIKNADEIGELASELSPVYGEMILNFINDLFLVQKMETEGKQQADKAEEKRRKNRGLLSKKR